MTDQTVRTDPNLAPDEKETTIGFTSREDRARIHSDHTAIVRWLLKHPDFEESSRNTGDGVIYSVTGTIPIGALKLSGRRANNLASGVTGKIPGDSDA